MLLGKRSQCPHKKEHQTGRKSGNANPISEDRKTPVQATRMQDIIEKLKLLTSRASAISHTQMQSKKNPTDL